MTDTQVQELLKPRYKVIADYPFNPFEVGFIYDRKLTEDKIKEFDKYPHLFKRLEWWEERPYMELPDVVGWIDPTTDTKEPVYFEVVGWVKSPNTADIVAVETHEGRLFIHDCLPATEDEYRSLINQTNSK